MEDGARDPQTRVFVRVIYTCARMRYALTPAAADFVRFAGLSCAGWYKLPSGEIKRAKREILRKILKCANFVVTLQPKIKT